MLWNSTVKEHRNHFNSHFQVAHDVVGWSFHCGKRKFIFTRVDNLHVTLYSTVNYNVNQWEYFFSEFLKPFTSLCRILVKSLKRTFYCKLGLNADSF